VIRGPSRSTRSQGIPVTACNQLCPDTKVVVVVVEVVVVVVVVEARAGG
jgi:hypothetical protein